MIKYVNGDIFKSKALILVNPVNTRGVSGAGLALEFKKRYPKNYRRYKEACDLGNLKIGKLHSYEEKGKLIINLPTKDDYKKPSKIEYIRKGLEILAGGLKGSDVSIAIPKLGCGLGGLKWEDVRAEIEKAFADCPEPTVYVYGPEK